MKKSTRKLKAKETLEIIQNGFYIVENGEKVSLKSEIDSAINRSRFFKSEELKTLKDSIELKQNNQTSFEVTSEDSISAILRLSNEQHEKLMCLNFASAKNPGGGFLNGALAQEESLAVSSALYGCQMSTYNFYETHRAMKSCMYTDGMINSPEVPVFRNKKGDLLKEFVLCSFITSAAVNKGVVKLKEKELLKDVSEIMSVRIEKMLTLCADQGYENLILGAWGCGVFQNDPIEIANLFHKHFNGRFKNQFKKVVFAIYSRNEKFIEPFKSLFN
ncbi:TIGR02452 family protein [Tenacibaculum sp. M341]|uniref:TIGR02452 family protein n=1 Tax=Tenacibaculum sp. M341 TaxID=2530339 RepID=UPI0010524217|nr:TIGR02452 family protein [Tenacibaculum sp. M341]TCI95057.1 TIGR02452 family protein [Tenacibaculum sp. M341]